MRIKVTYTFEYDANPEHYPEIDSAQGMADYDYNVDPAWFLTSCGDDPKLVAVEVPVVTTATGSTGFGCKRCGCREADTESKGLCVPCYEETQS